MSFQTVSKSLGFMRPPQSNRELRAFYRAFAIWNALRPELSWTHYRIISRVEEASLRQAYMHECAESGWNTRTLQRNIDSNYLGRLLNVPQNTMEIPSKTAIKMKRLCLPPKQTSPQK
jgi:hypothetical protein